VQERVKKVPTTEGAPLSVVTQVPVTGDVREDPVATTREGFSFMDATIDNIQRLCQQNEEKEVRIRELEERLQQVKIDERSLLNFKASAEKVRNDLEGAIIDMYANLHLFQNVAATIIDQNNQIQMQLTQYNTIREGIADIDTWIAENPDAPPELYRPSKSTRKTDMYALDHCQQVGKREDKEVTKAMVICSRTHKASQELIRNGHLPILDELGKNLVTEELVNAVQDNMSRRRQIVEATTFVSTDLIDQHLLQPVKLHTMIQAYMTRLEKDMSALDDNIAMMKQHWNNYHTGESSHYITSWRFGQLISEEKVHRERKNDCFSLVLFLTTSNFILSATCH
jgi:hypothetical protein